MLSIISDQLGVRIGSDSARTPEPDPNPAFKIEINLPSTPQGEKIEKILKQKLFREPANAGRLAVRLAMEVFFSKAVLLESSLTGDHGKLKTLNPEKMADIEDIIIRMYRGKVPDTKELWEKCNKAIAKKCQNLRLQQKKR